MGMQPHLSLVVFIIVWFGWGCKGSYGFLLISNMTVLCVHTGAVPEFLRGAAKEKKCQTWNRRGESALATGGDVHKI